MILRDTDVLIDIALDREPHVAGAAGPDGTFLGTDVGLSDTMLMSSRGDLVYGVAGAATAFAPQYSDIIIISMTTRSLGDLQHLVMVAVARLGPEAYGGAVQEELLRVAGRDVSVSSAYVTLVRLEEQGLLRSELDARGPGEVGRPRRVFAVTEAGWETLRAARDALDRIWDGVEPA